MPALGTHRTDRARRPAIQARRAARRIAPALAGVLLLTACTAAENFTRKVGNVFSEPEPPPRKVVTTPLPAGAPYPNLASVPGRPEVTPPERRDAEMARLEADHAAANVVDDSIRQRGPTPPALPPGAAEPESPFAAIGNLAGERPAAPGPAATPGPTAVPPAAPPPAPVAAAPAALSPATPSPAGAAPARPGTPPAAAAGTRTATGFQPGADLLTAEGRSLLELASVRVGKATPGVTVHVGGEGRLRENREVLAKAILVARGVPVRAIVLGAPLPEPDGLAVELR